MSEIRIGTDVEADDPIAGPHSMPGIGWAACTADKRLPSTFANLETRPGASAHPRTAAWWTTQAGAARAAGAARPHARAARQRAGVTPCARRNIAMKALTLS